MQSMTNPRAELLRAPNFRWLMAGSAVSLLGDQFTLIALPWLVLRMTGDTTALGLVLAFIGVPRALFILVGGAVVDRFSPYRVLMLTKHLNAALLAALVLGVSLGMLPLPALYALALALGLSSAFSIPSGTSMLPHAVRPQFLAAANSVMMGLRQLSLFIGPMAAGLLIALFGDGSGTVHQPTGIALAFAGEAIETLELEEVLSRPALDDTEIEPYLRGENIPLNEVAERQPGRFHLRGMTLTWSPSTAFSEGDAVLEMLDGGQQMIETVSVAAGEITQGRVLKISSAPLFARARVGSRRSAIAVIQREEDLVNNLRVAPNARIQKGLDKLRGGDFAGTFLYEALEFIDAEELKFAAAAGTHVGAAGAAESKPRRHRP
jgi:MFS family permease